MFVAKILFYNFFYKMKIIVLSIGFYPKKYFRWQLHKKDHFSQAHAKLAFPPKNPYFFFCSFFGGLTTLIFFVEGRRRPSLQQVRVDVGPEQACLPIFFFLPLFYKSNLRYVLRVSYSNFSCP